MKNPKGFKKRYFSLAAILAFSATATLANETKSFVDKQESTVAQEEYSESEELTPPSEELDVVVISKKIKVKEVDAPFASEIYTKKQIEKSHAKNVYEFLNTQTSVTLLPYYGNKFAPSIDMRGYGVENGNLNTVITLNGRRLNNIDSSQQFLSSIPIQSIEKIEILKGSGSVEYGDGANAGAINIITKKRDGVFVKSYIGSNNAKFGSFGVGVKEKYFSIDGYIDSYSDDGARYIDSFRKKDESWSRNKSINLSLTPIDDLEIKLGKSVAKSELKYANGMSYNEYVNSDINSVNKGSTTGYTDSDNVYLGVNYKFLNNYKFDTTVSREKKTNKIFVNYKYDYVSSDTKLLYNKDNLNILAGFQSFQGDRKKTGVKTTKDNLGYYIKSKYAYEKGTFSFGGRLEKVKYTHKDATHNLKSDESLNAFDIGYNYKLSNVSSVFINFNKSFQAPDIDKFFTYTGDFNQFIKPMKVSTLNIGYNYFSYPNKIKFSAFYSSIKDEIYYNTVTSKNTNFDKTNKYGFEVYDKYSIFYNLFATLNYSYVKTKIKEDSTNTSAVGNEIPGVSNHNVKVSLGYNPTHRINLLLSHIYKSKAYAMSDFDQSLGKMDAYNSTDFLVSYKYKKFEFYAKINNVFDRKNALFVDGWSGLTVYPVNYERNFIVGMSAKF